MQELARDTFMYECFPEVMGMLWKRIYKSLLLLSYLLRNGSERVVTSAREHLYDLKSLQDYTFHDPQGKDQGINVRNKSKDIIALIQDYDRLREERKRAKKNRDKYVGMSSSDARFGSSGRGSSGGGGTRHYEWKADDNDDDDGYTDTPNRRLPSQGSGTGGAGGYSDDESVPSDTENNSKITKQPTSNATFQ